MDINNRQYANSNCKAIAEKISKDLKYLDDSKRKNIIMALCEVRDNNFNDAMKIVSETNIHYEEVMEKLGLLRKSRISMPIRPGMATYNPVAFVKKRRILNMIPESKINFKSYNETTRARRSKISDHKFPSISSRDINANNSVSQYMCNNSNDRSYNDNCYDDEKSTDLRNGILTGSNPLKKNILGIIEKMEKSQINDMTINSSRQKQHSEERSRLRSIMEYLFTKVTGNKHQINYSGKKNKDMGAKNEQVRMNKLSNINDYTNFPKARMIKEDINEAQPSDISHHNTNFERFSTEGTCYEEELDPQKTKIIEIPKLSINNALSSNLTDNKRQAFIKKFQYKKQEKISQKTEESSFLSNINVNKTTESLKANNDNLKINNDKNKSAMKSNNSPVNRLNLKNAGKHFQNKTIFDFNEHIIKTSNQMNRGCASHKLNLQQIKKKFTENISDMNHNYLNILNDTKDGFKNNKSMDINANTYYSSNKNTTGFAYDPRITGFTSDLPSSRINSSKQGCYTETRSNISRLNNGKFVPASLLHHQNTKERFNANAGKNARCILNNNERYEILQRKKSAKNRIFNNMKKMIDPIKHKGVFDIEGDLHHYYDDKMVIFDFEKKKELYRKIEGFVNNIDPIQERVRRDMIYQQKDNDDPVDVSPEDSCVDDDDYIIDDHKNVKLNKSNLIEDFKRFFFTGSSNEKDQIFLNKLSKWLETHDQKKLLTERQTVTSNYNELYKERPTSRNVKNNQQAKTQDRNYKTPWNIDYVQVLNYKPDNYNRKNYGKQFGIFAPANSQTYSPAISTDSIISRDDAFNIKPYKKSTKLTRNSNATTNSNKIPDSTPDNIGPNKLYDGSNWMIRAKNKMLMKELNETSDNDESQFDKITTKESPGIKNEDLYYFEKDMLNQTTSKNIENLTKENNRLSRKVNKLKHMQDKSADIYGDNHQNSIHKCSFDNNTLNFVVSSSKRLHKNVFNQNETKKNISHIERKNDVDTVERRIALDSIDVRNFKTSSSFEDYHNLIKTSKEFRAIGKDVASAEPAVLNMNVVIPEVKDLISETDIRTTRKFANAIENLPKNLNREKIVKVSKLARIQSHKDDDWEETRVRLFRQEIKVDTIEPGELNIPKIKRDVLDNKYAGSKTGLLNSESIKYFKNGQQYLDNSNTLKIPEKVKKIPNKKSVWQFTEWQDERKILDDFEIEDDLDLMKKMSTTNIHNENIICK